MLLAETDEALSHGVRNISDDQWENGCGPREQDTEEVR